ncbi:MAG: autotransporter outer membrane beta-barrel domain-containing protein, partial [Planctomycetaceae bacterium]|nr:autotransporter outer membrane beta-barrel domain-containing protein [Planctomycetaceae bacterium]
GVIITNSNYYDNNYSSGTTYSSSSSYFHLTNTYTITNSGVPVAGIFSTFENLQLDLAGQTITVENTAGTAGVLSGVAAGFGYSSDNDFVGTISTGTTTPLGNFTATSDIGAAYGMIFAKQNMDQITNIGSDAIINVGNLKATTSSNGDVAVGFQAFDIANGAKITITSIDTTHKGTGGSITGILLGNVSGSITEQTTNGDVAGINITGKVTGAKTVASGLHATEISDGANIKLGKIKITNDNSSAAGHMYGVQINQVGSGVNIPNIPGASNSKTIGQISGILEIGDISLGTDGNRAVMAAGLLLKNDNSILDRESPGITSTGKVTLSKITVFSESDYAIGISLGYYDSDPAANHDLGYAAADTLILNEDIEVKSNTGDAIGIFAGQIENLDVAHKIIAEGNNAGSYGIKTTGKKNSQGAEEYEASTINIINNDTSGAGVIAGTTKSISLGASSDDTVNLKVNGWLNDNNAFTMEGVEIFNITADNDFTNQAGIKDSKRGTATLSNTNTVTNINSGVTFTAFNSFFNGGKQVISGGGTLNIEQGTSYYSSDFIESLEFNGGVSVNFAAGAQLILQDSTLAPSVTITGGSTVTFNREGNDIGGIGREEWLTGNNWTDNKIQLTIDGGSTLKFQGNLSNSGDQAWYLHPFETFIGEGGATIYVDENLIIEAGTIEKKIGVSNNISITKIGSGELKLIDTFDLGTNGLINLEEGTLSVYGALGSHNSGFTDPIIKNSPSIKMQGTSVFELEGNVELDSLTGVSRTTLKLNANQLLVNSGLLTSKIIGTANSQIIKNSTSGTLTIDGDNSEMAGALIQNEGIVELQSNWGRQSSGGRIVQNGGTFIFNGGSDGTVRVYGDTTFKDEVEIKSKIQVKSFVLGNDAEITISVNPINQNWDNLIKSEDTAFDTTTQNKLQAEANKEALLYSREGTFNDNFTSFNIQYDTISVSDFALQHGMTKNLSRIGILFDGLMQKYPDFATSIYNNVTEAEDLESILTSLLGSELAANAQMLAFSSPHNRVFNHLRSLNRSMSSGILGQSKVPSFPSIPRPHFPNILTLNYDLWFEGNFLSESVRGDDHSFGYDVERGGMFIGLDAKLGDRIISGLMFGYGNPHISNRIGKISADDIQFGIYSRFRLFWECSVNVFLGYGVQQFKYTNSISAYTTDYGGDALYASLEVFRPITIYTHSQLIPIAAIDFQKAWSDAFVEGDQNNLGLQIGKSDINQAILRFGLNSKIVPTRQFQLRTRFQYGLQVSGDLYASAPTNFSVNPTITQNIRSVKRGRHNLNIGIGTDFYTLDDSTRFFFDYDYNYNQKSNSHAIQIGLISTR